MDTNQYLLTVTFSAPERKKVLDDPMASFEAAMAGAFPDRRHIHTVSNPRYATGPDPYLGDALAHLQDADILIQPCLISAGPEWARMKGMLPPDIPVGLPLLNDEEDCLRCAEALLPTLPKQAVVFMAHGSKHPDAPDFAPTMEVAFAALGRPDIYFANLEGANSLEGLLPRLREGSVQLRPFLFHPRLHRQRDLEQRWVPALEQAGHRVDCRHAGLCAYPEIQALYIAHAKGAHQLGK